MKAIIELDVPGFQIGQEVTVYFKDSMQTKGVCVAEPIVRCKDCKRKQRIEGTENIIYCPHVRMRVPVDWFCADGARK